MRRLSGARIVVAVVPLFALTALYLASADDKAPNRYASPAAVFDAFRKARAKKDMRSVFPLLTPEAQDHCVAESFFSCMEAGSKRTGDVVPKFVDGAALTDDYDKAYKKKHDVATAKREQRKNPTSAPPPHDGQLWNEVVVAHVKDKVGFCEAVEKLFGNNPVEPLGDLEQVAVDGDTATGKAKLTLGPLPGELPRAVDKIDTTYRFRKIDGGWLLDSL
jgi:hypothetical protein